MHEIALRSFYKRKKVIDVNSDESHIISSPKERAYHILFNIPHWIDRLEIIYPSLWYTFALLVAILSSMDTDLST